jgi:hypothetical protein
MRISAALASALHGIKVASPAPTAVHFQTKSIDAVLVAMLLLPPADARRALSQTGASANAAAAAQAGASTALPN